MDKVVQAINDIKANKLVIVVDRVDRENEGDFICNAQNVNVENIAMMLNYGRGLICAPMSKQIANKLNIKPMQIENNDNHSTNFAISIDHISNSTGISATDRTNTLRALAHNQTQANDFRRPGHMFPLIARNGGVLVREGHTEATVDLMRLANLVPVGVCCEILNAQGEPMRINELKLLAEQLQLVLISIDDIINYIKTNNINLYEND